MNTIAQDERIAQAIESGNYRIVRTFEQKLSHFAALLEKQQADIYKRRYPNSPLDPPKVRIVPGRTYTKVDIQSGPSWSGRYMVDQEGRIWGIKAYGVINRRHCYGTLDTVDQLFWGEYTGFKVS